MFIHFFQKNLTDPAFLNGNVHYQKDHPYWKNSDLTIHLPYYESKMNCIDFDHLIIAL